MPDELKSTDLVRARRIACTSPHLCFEFGDNVSCPPCETLGAGILRERERCVGIVTALWGADLVTTQAAMSGELTLDEAVLHR